VIICKLHAIESGKAKHAKKVEKAEPKPDKDEQPEVKAETPKAETKVVRGNG
jgi:hypothetical protein